jgi:hypothetical protein
MTVIRFFFLFLFLDMSCTGLKAQVGDYHASVEAQGVLTTRDHTPFWLRSDQFGSIPLPGTSGSLIGAAAKQYDSASKRLVDWGGSVELRADIGQGSRLTLIEGFLKARLGIFELKAGRAKEIMGLVDTSLSSGAFAISGNALGIPKVQLAIPDYYSLPFLGKILAIQGNFAYGWLGQVPIQTGTLVDHAETYFSQVSLYGKFGKPSWKWKLDGGFNHQVFWGSEKNVFGKGFALSPWKTYEYAVLGKTYQGSKIGNHLGSIDLGAEVELGKIKIMIYRQNFYDEGALYHFANLRDGLNGLSVMNRQQGLHKLKWRKFLLEVFYSKDQAGYPTSKPTPSGDENYYNNYEYGQGWSYKGLGLGNPFITPVNSTRAGLPNDPRDYFNNNRVVAFYGGMEGSVSDWQFTAKASYSLNYGTFGTSPWGHSTGSVRNPPLHGLFTEQKEFSGFLEVKKPLGHDLDLGLVAALDNGGLFDNTGGFILKLNKSF